MWWVRGMITSLAPHFHGEEALRKMSPVFSKLCLFKTLNPSWALPHPNSNLQSGPRLLRLWERLLRSGPHPFGGHFPW